MCVAVCAFEHKNAASLKWEDCNPEKFTYLNNYEELTKDAPYYSDNKEDIDNVYFVTRYAMKSDEEDRADTFSYLLASDSDFDLPKTYDSHHVKE